MHNLSRVVRFAVLFTISLIPVLPAFAADETAYWLGGEGDWTDPTLWSSADYPHNNGMTYDAIIDNVTGLPYRVRLNGYVTLDSFLLDSTDATVKHWGGEFRVLGNFELNNGMFHVHEATIYGGTIRGSDNASFALEHGTLVGVTLERDLLIFAGGIYDDNFFRDGFVLAGGVVRLGDEGLTIVDVYFENTPVLAGNGLIVFNGSRHHDNRLIASDGPLTIDPGVTIRSGSGNGIIFTDQADNLINKGTIVAENGRKIILSGYPLINEGSLETKDGGILSLIRLSTNLGQISVHDGGELKLIDSVIDKPITFSNGKLSLQGTWDNLAGVNISDGALGLSGTPQTFGTFVLDNSDVSIFIDLPTSQIETIQYSNTTIIVDGQSVIDNTGYNLLLTPYKGNWELADGNVVGGTITGSDGAKIAATSGFNALENVELQADLEIESGAELTINGGFIGGQTTLLNGELNLEGGAWNEGSIIVTGELTLKGGATNEGTITAAGGTVRLRDNWSNTGIISVSDGTLKLSGTPQSFGAMTAVDSTIELDVNCTTAQIQSISRTSSPVEIKSNAILDNSGDDLALDAASGSYLLNGGAIVGGSISSTDGAALVIPLHYPWDPPTSPSVLDGVILAADLDIPYDGTLIVWNGLTLDESEVRMESAISARVYPAIVYFPGTQTLGGSGEIIFGGYSSDNYVRPDTGTLTIGPEITIRTGDYGGTIGYESNDIISYGTISAQTDGMTINITGGTFTNYGTLESINGGTIVIDPSTTFINEGSFAIGASAFSIQELSVGRNNPGMLNVTDAAADITVSNLMHIGPNGSINAVPGATIHMTGSAFENESTDPAALAGLSNLTLIFEGGSEDIDPFEVAGEDMGPVMAGLEDNFAHGTLQLGGADIGQLQLVDIFDNQPGWEGDEALYVENLVLGAGSLLDLNGLNLYYIDGQIDPSAIIDYSSGGSLAQILLPGDANGDGVVSADDYGSVQANFGNTGVPGIPGDATGDGMVSADDYASVQVNFGDTAGMGSVPVPEPATLGLLGIGGVALLRRCSAQVLRRRSAQVLRRKKRRL